MYHPFVIYCNSFEQEVWLLVSPCSCRGSRESIPFVGVCTIFVDVLKVHLVTDVTIVHRNYISCQLFALVEDRLYAINSIILYVC